MKKLFLTLILFGFGLFAIAQDLDTVNIGTGPNSRNGDPLRTAFSKINDAIIALNALLTGYGGGWAIYTIFKRKVKYEINEKKPE